MIRSLIALLAALALLSGCVSRTGTPEPESSASAQSAPESIPDASSGSVSSSPAGESAPDDAASAEETVRRLLEEEHLFALLSAYSGNFDKAEDLQPIPLLWSVFAWYRAGSEYAPADPPDHAGFLQAEKEVLDAAAARWYGVEAVDFPGNPQTVGDPAAGDAVNADLAKGRYYFIDALLPTDAGYTLHSAKALAGGGIEAQIDGLDAAGQYVQTYYVKLTARGASYAVASLNKGRRT